jgi:hypothetical protein
MYFVPIELDYPGNLGNSFAGLLWLRTIQKPGESFFLSFRLDARNNGITITCITIRIRSRSTGIDDDDDHPTIDGDDSVGKNS